MRVELRCVAMGCGELFVTVTGTQGKQMLCASSKEFKTQVRIHQKPSVLGRQTQLAVTYAYNYIH